MKTNERPKCARALEAALRRLGYKPGYPETVTPLTRATDKRTTRRMKCPGCRRRGLGCRPFHKGASFRLVAACPVCLAAEEA